MDACVKFYRFFLMVVIAVGLVSGPALQSRSHANGDPAPPGAGAGAGDPWEKFNRKMFSFNREVDRWFLEPVAAGYDFVLPDVAQTGVRNAISNIDVARRLANSLLQLKFEGAAREILRFTINSTFGIGGLVDFAKISAGIPQSDEDTGQTMGVYGIKPGPYLVLPFFLPPMTVRDGIGAICDRAMNPLLYVGMFVDGATGVGNGASALNAVNERSRNLEAFKRLEDSVDDLYGAVRNAYLQKREAAVRE